MTDQAGAELLIRLEHDGALTPTGLKLTDPHLPIVAGGGVGADAGPDAHDTQVRDRRLAPLHRSRLPVGVVAAVGGAQPVGGDAEGVHARQPARPPHRRRRRQLDWSHHRAVAALPPAEQTEWLRTAERERLSHHSCGRRYVTAPTLRRRRRAAAATGRYDT